MGSAAGNPLFDASPLPYLLPPFATVTPAHYAPAFDAGMAEQLAEIAVITASTEPATFENTVVALERSGQLLTRVSDVFFNLVSAHGTPEIRAIETEYAPRLAAHRDAIQLDTELFARLDRVHAHRHTTGLGPEEIMLVERHHSDHVLAGARLDPAGQTRLRALNQQISRASTAFEQTLLAAMAAAALVLTDVRELDGMSAASIAGAAAAAIERGHHGRWVIPLVLPTGQPALSVLRDPAVRRRLHGASVDRASTGPHATGALAVEIARLRAERARLLGFATHADVEVADQTAKTTATVDAMLARLVGPALANARAEAAILGEFAARDGVELAAWDWAFYAERVRAERYAVDTAALRPYFELDRVLHDGVFYAAEQVYGVTFTRRPDLVGYHPDVRVWEVRDADGSPIGLYLGDFFAREAKRGGAWMNSLVEQSRLLDQRPVVVNNLNITRAAPGDPTLLSLDEVRTLFHEFGHALHGLFSDVTYPLLAGTQVPRDFVEFPSQVNEMWARWPAVLANYARHVDTGAPLPPEQVAAIDRAELWGMGLRTTEYLAATLLDQAWHRIAPDDEIPDPAAFEAAALKAAGVAFDLVPPRYRTTYFQHIFSGGYAAGYYSYIWAEILDAETVEWFTENGGMTRANGDTFRRGLLSVGGTVDSLAAFRAVRGRDADIEPLLRRRGLG